MDFGSGIFFAVLSMADRVKNNVCPRLAFTVYVLHHNKQEVWESIVSILQMKFKRSEEEINLRFYLVALPAKALSPPHLVLVEVFFPAVDERTTQIFEC